MKLLTNNETADMIGIKPNTLENWRLRGKGPKFLKIGRLTRYRQSDVHAWLGEQTHASTSEYKRGNNPPPLSV